MNRNLLDNAKKWLERADGSGFLNDEDYCPARDIFQARLEKFRAELQSGNFSNTPLLTAIIGEMGNNSFDHNLGNWRDVPGVYFKADDTHSSVIISDRGQGIRKTISRVKPGIETDAEAIRIAFTERISGRSPEQRGNGLKFVKKIIEEQKWQLDFLSGNGIAKTDDAGVLQFSETNENILGCIAYIEIQ